MDTALRAYKMAQESAVSSDDIESFTDLMNFPEEQHDG
jgi:hypothetical protein